MNKNPKIIWEKWYSPFGEDDIDEEYNSQAIDDLMDDIYSSADSETIEDPPTMPNSMITKYMNKQKFMITPMGVMPLTENTESGKIFNFWLGHTNFDITRDIASIIESRDGVESLDVFTRYRFRISIGKAFVDSEIMHDINNKIYGAL